MNKHDRLVTVRDGKTAFRMPVRELASGMARTVNIESGEVAYVNRNQLHLHDFILHPPFPPGVASFLEAIWADIKTVYPMSPEQWIEGFRYDLNPWKEIALWELIRDAYLRFTRHLVPGAELEKRVYIFRAILHIIHAGEMDAAVAIVAGPRLSASRVREMHSWLCSKENCDRLCARMQEVHDQMAAAEPRYWVVKKIPDEETQYEVSGRLTLVASRNGEDLARPFANGLGAIVQEVPETLFAMRLYLGWPEIRSLTLLEAADEDAFRMLHINLDSFVGKIKAAEKRPLKDISELCRLQSHRVAQGLRELLAEADRGAISQPSRGQGPETSPAS